MYVGSREIPQTFINNRTTFDETLDPIIAALIIVADKGDKYFPPGYAAVGAIIITFGIILCVGAFLAWRGPTIPLYFVIQTWVVLPLFFLAVVLVGVAIAVTGMVLVVDSGE